MGLIAWGEKSGLVMSFGVLEKGLVAFLLYV